MSWSPGLITRIDGEWMEVKVPTGEDCGVCPARSACNFEGPTKAYRVFQVARQADYAKGDRVEVEDPASVLVVVVFAFVLVPVLLLGIGFELLTRFDKIAHVPILVSAAGIIVWLSVIFLANRWVSRAKRFQTRIRACEQLDGKTKWLR